jgi:hypothetical protein
MSHFEKVRGGIRVNLSDEERVFLGDVLPLLAGVGSSPDDPAAERLNVPVYLDDPASNEEWWRLMGEDLAAGRAADRTVFERVVGDEGSSPVVSSDEADSILRVLNEARLALGARMGVEVEADHDALPEHSRAVLDYLGWIQEELTVALMRGL